MVQCRILAHHATGLNGHAVVEEFCQRLDESTHKNVRFYMAFQVDRMEELMQSDKSKTAQLLPKAQQVKAIDTIGVHSTVYFDIRSAVIIQYTLLVYPQLLQSLATETDPIRCEYWLFLSRCLHSQFAQ